MSDNLASGSEEENHSKHAVVGIPAYNEEITIASVIFKAKRYVDDVIVVDDGSSDDTAGIAEEAGAMVIKHEESMGYAATLRTLIHHARDNDMAPLVIIDGYAEHPVNKIPDLLENILNGKADITIGSRFLDDEKKKGVPPLRRFGLRILKKMNKSKIAITTPKGEVKKITDRQSGFRAFSKEALNKINPSGSGVDAFSDILREANSEGLKVQEIPISVTYKGKISTKRLSKKRFGSLTGVVQYIETKDSLLSFGVLGMIAFLLGIYMGTRTVMIYNEVGSLPIVYVVITVLLFFGGLVAGMIGLILHAVINAHKRGYQ
ncbi:MAG: glycosyltransferase family 2 protein [Thermoplasmatota archaeon]